MRSHLFEAAAPEIRVAGNPFDGCLRVQLKGQPRHLNQVLPLELFDSDRVDVAPGSNVVGEDDELDRFDFASHTRNLLHPRRLYTERANTNQALEKTLRKSR